MSQHDVDIESDSTIIFFNNGSQTLKGDRPDKWRLAENLIQVSPQHSGITRYYLSTGEFERFIRIYFQRTKYFLSRKALLKNSQMEAIL